jgi:hypothetical protein
MVSQRFRGMGFLKASLEGGASRVHAGLEGVIGSFESCIAGGCQLFNLVLDRFVVLSRAFVRTLWMPSNYSADYCE